MTHLPTYHPSFHPGLHLIFASENPPFPTEDLLKARISGDALANQEPIALRLSQADAQQFLGEVEFDQHHLQIAGMPYPLPQEVIDRTVMVSPWPAQTKAAMRHHHSQLRLDYLRGNPNPIEQMIALYRLASAVMSEDLLGIVNPNAWTAHPPADYLSPDQIAQYRQEIPFNLWFGYVRFYTDDQSYWLATKGHHIFDVPDLATFVQPTDDTNALINLFINVFYYLYEQDVFVTAGDTLEIRNSGEQLRFSEVTELSDLLMGPSGTLVIEKNYPPN